MKASILYFSPCGTTRQVALSLKESLGKTGWQVQEVDMTADPDLFPDPDYPKFFEKIPAHDLLAVGGPVYIDHLHYNVLELLHHLPLPGGGWGKGSVLFTTFGKVSPGIALAEGARVLSRRNREILGALETDSTHCLSLHYSRIISPGLPGPELSVLSGRLAESLAEIYGKKGKKKKHPDLNLMLQTLYDRIKEIKDEKEILDKTFPPVVFDYSLCTGCLACVNKCPVRHLVEVSGRPGHDSHSSCIHCARCLSECPAGAIKKDLSAKEAFLMQKLEDEGLDARGPSRSQLYLP